MPKLDKHAVAAAQPKGRAYVIWDDDLPGFGLRVYASGRRTYLIQYKEGGRTRQFSMGSHEDLTPTAARQKAKKLLADAAAPDAEGGTSTRRPARQAPKKEAADEAPSTVAVARKPLARVSAASVGPSPSAKSPGTAPRAPAEGISEPPPPESGFRRIGAVIVLISVVVIGGLWYASESTELVRTATTTDEPVPPEGGARQPSEDGSGPAAADTPPAMDETATIAATAPDVDKSTQSAPPPTESSRPAGSESMAPPAGAASEDETENAAAETPENERSTAEGAAEPDSESVAATAPTTTAEPKAGTERRKIDTPEAAASIRPAAGPTTKPPVPVEPPIERRKTEDTGRTVREIARIPPEDPGDIAARTDAEQELESMRQLADRDPPIHECDRLSDDPAAAMRACEEALNTYPNAARFKAQYADAVEQAGDPEEAVDWHRQAAEQGYGAAQHKLGTLFESGSSVSQDYAEAYFWYTLALRRGNVAAGRNRDAIEGRLTRYEKESIGRRVRSWRPIP